MSMDIFSTRFMLALLEQLYPPKTYLLDTFFQNTVPAQAETIEIDIVKGKRRLAPFVKYTSEGKVVERIGFVNSSFKPAYIKEKMQCNANDLLTRNPGQTIYQGNSNPVQRAAELLAKDLAELQDMITRREEWMAAKALFTGKIPIKGEGYDAEIDFLFDATHKVTLTGTDLWTNAASNPIAKLQEFSDICGQDSGLNPDVCILGQTVSATLLANTKFQQLLDNRRIELGQINPQNLPSGAIFLGTLKDPAIDLYRYNEYYLDEDTGLVTPMVPKDSICMGSTKARTARHYGLIKDIEAGSYSGNYFPKSWITPDPAVRWLMLQSAPLVCIHQPDAFLYAKVV